MTTDVTTEQPGESEGNGTREAIERKTGKSAEALYEEREKRVREAIRLEEPDRVPVLLGMAYFPARYAGVPRNSPDSVKLCGSVRCCANPKSVT